MALPKKLKDFNVFDEGDSYKGRIPEFTLPTLARKMSEYRAGGMSGSVKTDMGAEAMTSSFTIAEYSRAMLEQWGITTVDGIELRFRGSALSDSIADEEDAIEVVMRGRFSEINFDTAKSGDDSNMKITAEISYFKYSLNDEAIIEIDHVNNIEIVAGVDLLEQRRANLGI